MNILENKIDVYQHLTWIETHTWLVFPICDVQVNPPKVQSVKNVYLQRNINRLFFTQPLNIAKISISFKLFWFVHILLNCIVIDTLTLRDTQLYSIMKRQIIEAISINFKDFVSHIHIGNFISKRYVIFIHFSLNNNKKKVSNIFFQSV